MKILCLQLARFGDIYQTWPVVHALSRQYPDAKIDFLVREKFASAAAGLKVNKVWSLPVQNILKPLIVENFNIDKSTSGISDFINELKNQSFDRIINLSFSPLSSYIVDAISTESTAVSGYTRFSDGFLNIPDDPSSYFYAQVGVAKHNRIHITDVFALISGVELDDSDFHAPISSCNKPTDDPYIVIHIGASQPNKTCSHKSWAEITDHLLKIYSGRIIFIGSQADNQYLPQNICPSLPDGKDHSRVMNWVGKTQLPELFSILAGAEALIGCDSVGVQMASLTGTKTLNISFSSVRFWETGPRAKGSRILWYTTPESTDPVRVAEEAVKMVRNEAPRYPIILKDETNGLLYSMYGYEEDDFSWNLIKAIYLNQPLPLIDKNYIKIAIQRLLELAQVGIEQVEILKAQKDPRIAVDILNQVDHLIVEVGRFAPELEPLIFWFQAEKSRIAPGAIDEITRQTLSVFQKLYEYCELYGLNNKFNDELSRGELQWKL